MKRIKSFISGILIGSICTCAVSGIAVGVWDKIDVLRNDIKVVVNGKEIAADNFLYNDTTYLPMRAIGEALGEKVDYDQASNTAYIGERTDNLNIDKNTGFRVVDYQEIKDQYPNIDEFDKDPGGVVGLLAMLDGRYYISASGIQHFFNLRNFVENGKLVVAVNDDIQKEFSYFIQDERGYIPFDDFMEQVYPYIK